MWAVRMINVGGRPLQNHGGPVNLLLARDYKELQSNSGAECPLLTQRLAQDDSSCDHDVQGTHVCGNRDANAGIRPLMDVLGHAAALAAEQQTIILREGEVAVGHRRGCG